MELSEIMELSENAKISQILPELVWEKIIPQLNTNSLVRLMYLDDHFEQNSRLSNLIEQNIPLYLFAPNISHGGIYNYGLNYICEQCPKLISINPNTILRKGGRRVARNCEMHGNFHIEIFLITNLNGTVHTRGNMWKIKDIKQYVNYGIELPKYQFRFYEEDINTIYYRKNGREFSETLDIYLMNQYQKRFMKKYPQMYLHALDIPLDNTTFQMGNSPSFYKISHEKYLDPKIQKHLMWSTELKWTDPELALCSQ